jgi:hypothetical protein
MCYDSIRERMIMCGGSNGQYFDDTWEYYDVPPTPTPTITPTPTFTPSPSPSPTPTSTPADGIVLTLHLPEKTVHARDSFYLDVAINNCNAQTLNDVPFFVILEVTGTFWYYPTWRLDPTWEILATLPTGSLNLAILKPFDWPDNAGTGNARFWGALTNSDMTRILGQYDVRDFAWE